MNAYQIIYDVPTAHGFTDTHSIVAKGREAVDIVNKCHALGYKIIEIKYA